MLPSASQTDASESEDEKRTRYQSYTCAEYVHNKFFFYLVVADCLFVVRLVPALIAYCKTTTSSIKAYFVFKLVTFFLYFGGSIVFLVLLLIKLRQSNVEQTVQLQIQRLANDYKSSKVLLILTCTFILFDGVSCYLLSLVLRFAILRER